VGKISKLLLIHGVKSALLIMAVVGLFVADRVYGVFAPQQLPTEIYLILLGTMFKDNKAVMTLAKYILNYYKPKRKKNN